MVSESDGLLEILSVSKQYRQLKALDNVSFSVRKGEIFGYIGPNGAGKTTTMKVIVGLLKDFEGDVRIMGQSIRGNGNDAYRRIGYLPQRAAFQEWRTVDNALKTFGRLSGIPRQELDNRIDEVLELIGISDTRNRRIPELSGGTAQKVGLAQAIIHRPELLILDEPMAGLDPASRYMFKQLFKDLAKKNGTTVLLSSHILSDLQDVGDRIGILNGGRIMHLGTVENLRQRLKMANEIDLVLSKADCAVSGLGDIEGVKEMETVGPGAYRIHLADPDLVDEVTNLVLQQLLKSKCRVRSINPVLPTLEELYMRLLGGGAR